MLDHVGIQCDDMEAATAFYDAVLATLGSKRMLDFDVAVGYGSDRPVFWVGQATDEIPNRQSHLAFAAPDRDHVIAFHDAAVALGAEVLHEPREWAEYHPNYFGAFVRDPDGNNVEAVCHDPA
jgi:catechol 2,3-dioxygenase-like lactoylglutathione lyase family enzyme